MSPRALVVALLLTLAPRADADADGDTRDGDQTEVRVGWDGLHVRGSTGHRMELHLLAQARVSVDDAGDDGVHGGGTVVVARPFLRYATPHDRVRVTLQADLANGPRLLDAFVDGEVAPGVRLAAGQMIVQATRAWNTPFPLRAGMEFSEGNRLLTPGRRLGTQLVGSMAGGRVLGWAGVFSPVDTLDLATGVHAPLGMLRIQVHPVGSPVFDERRMVQAPMEPTVSVGAGMLVEPVQDAVDPDHDIARWTGLADVAVQAGGFSGFLDGFLRTSTPREAFEWSASAHLLQMVVPRHLDVGTRVTGTRTQEVDAPRLTVEALVDGYPVGAHLLVQARYRWTRTPAAQGHGGDLQMQVWW